MSPKVSILMSSATFDPFFEDCLRCIEEQSFRDFEVILVVEKDKDKYEALFKKFEIDETRFRVIVSYLPGFATCLNLGLQSCVGLYVARMDTDDLMSHDRLHKQATFLDGNPEVGIVGSKAIAVDKNGDRIKGMKLRFYETDSAIKAVLPFRNPLFHSALMLRRNLFTKFGGYKYDFHAQDHECWIRWMIQDPSVKFHNIPEALYFYRRHENQGTHVRHARRAFRDISCFLLRFFLQTGNPKYLLGIVFIVPVFRKIRNFILRRQ